MVIAHQQGCIGSKTLLQHNPSLVSWSAGLWIMQVVLYNGHKMLVVIDVVMYSLIDKSIINVSYVSV